MAITALIFDVDGVLADSREAVVENTMRLMREFGIKVDESRVRKMSSAHSAKTVLVSLAPFLADDRVLLKRMLSRLSEITLENISLVKPTLLAEKIPALSEKYALACATNRKSSARAVLGQLGILGYFRAVLTSKDAPHKPDPGMVRMALERLSVEAASALFVGDNEEDRMAGIGASVEFAMVDGTDDASCQRLLLRLL